MKLEWIAGMYMNVYTRQILYDRGSYHAFTIDDSLAVWILCCFAGRRHIVVHIFFPTG